MPSITGTDAADTLAGTSGSDIINGLAGDDVIDAGAGDDVIDGGSGSDTMSGGLGDDTYLVEDIGDLVVEADGEGRDTVNTALLEYTLADNIENLSVSFLTVRPEDIYSHSFASYAGNLLGNAIDVVEDGFGSKIEVHGQGGDDTITVSLGTGGTLGSFDIYGDEGNDTITGASIVDGPEGDVLNLLGGGDGDDVIYGGNAAGEFSLANYLFGNEGADTLVGGSAMARNHLLGGAGDDVLYGNGIYNLLDGGAGADLMYACSNADSLNEFVVDDIGDEVIAGAGTDFIRLLAGGNYTISEGVEFVSLTGTGQTVTGNNSGATYEGIDAGDTVTGGSGDDTYYVNAANAVIVEFAAGGNDTLVTAAAKCSLAENIENLVTGSMSIKHSFTGNSSDNIISGGNLRDVIDGGEGDDTISGEDGDDLLFGAGGVDAIHGGSGADILHGQNGNDSLYGGDGGDRLYGDSGDDHLEGGTGDDIYFVDSAGDNVIEAVGGGTDEVRALGVAVILGENVENLRILSGNTSGAGNALANLLVGSNGANLLEGLDGNDILRGNGGADTLLGGAGLDSLYGGDGRDTLTGGAGVDRFFFMALSESSPGPAFADRITDFSQAEHDRIVLSAIDAIAGGTDDAFTFIGTAGFSGTAGELRYRFDANHDTVVMMDVNGDGVVDMSIVLTGEINLTGGDFVL